MISSARGYFRYTSIALVAGSKNQGLRGVTAVQTENSSLYAEPTQAIAFSSLSTTQHNPHLMRVWHWIAWGCVMLLAVFLNFFRLWQIGYGNSYYASGVLSMSMNWHNFFFVSYDPGGFVTIDKPPLGFWLQTLSVQLFGFSGFSLFLPQALAGTLSVALLFHLVRRNWGPVAGLLAALVLTLTPISIVTNRNNTIDSLLVCTTLLATWAVCLATEQGRLRWLLVCGLLVGIGFNIKMLEAYLVLPAFGLLYLLAAPRKWWQRLLHLLLALLIMLVVSFSWAAIVDAIPSSQRPYVGSSSVNSEINLAIGYNGLQRLLGRGSSKPAATHTTGNSAPLLLRPQAAVLTAFAGKTSSTQAVTLATQPTKAAETKKAPAAKSGTGNVGPLRFFNEQLSGQISWLLPLAFFALLAIAWRTRVRFPLTREYQTLMLWGLWLITMFCFFSAAQFFNIYYLVMLAPAIAALVGIGIVTMWHDYLHTGFRGWLLPLVLITTAAIQYYLLTHYSTWSSALAVPVILFVTSASIMLFAVRLVVLFLASIRAKNIVTTRSTFADADTLPPGTTIGQQGKGWLRYSILLSPLVILSMLVLLLTPLIWGVTPVLFRSSSEPLATPTRPSTTQAIVTPDPSFEKLLHYLQTNRGSTRFLLATVNSGYASPFILASKEPVMALGGFGGGDQILSLAQLQASINDGTVRYFWLQNNPTMHQIPHGLKKQSKETQTLAYTITTTYSSTQAAPMGNSLLTYWVANHCQILSQRIWQTGPARHPHHYGFGLLHLYDCSILH